MLLSNNHYEIKKDKFKTQLSSEFSSTANRKSSNKDQKANKHVVAQLKILGVTKGEDKKAAENINENIFNTLLNDIVKPEDKNRSEDVFGSKSKKARDKQNINLEMSTTSDRMKTTYQYYNKTTSVIFKNFRDNRKDLTVKAVIENTEDHQKFDNNEIPSENSQSYSSSSLPYTGINCKEKSTKPRMEMRGTNYWALYNYIPADEVTRFI